MGEFLEPTFFARKIMFKKIIKGGKIVCPKDTNCSFLREIYIFIIHIWLADLMRRFAWLR